MKRKTRIILIAGAVIVAGGTAFAMFSRPKIRYETDVVTRGTIVDEVSVTGSVAPKDKIALEPEVSAKIADIAVSVGSEVKSGDVLVRLDARDLAAKIDGQRAAVDSARARLAELVAGATTEDVAVSEKGVEAAMSKADAAMAAQVDAKVSLENAEKSLVNTQAKADAQMTGKTADLFADYDDAVTKATDAVFHLSDGLFTSDDHLTFTTTSSQSENDARATRLLAKSALGPLASAVADAKAAGTPAAALAAYQAVSTDLAVVKGHLDADANVLDYALGVPSATLSTYRQNVSTGQTNLTLASQGVVTSKSALDLQMRLNDADVTAAQIAVSNAKAAVTASKFAVDSAQKALEQAKAELAYKRSGSRPEVVAAQRAQVATQEAALASLQAELSKRSIVAPADGVITDVAVKKGETARPGAPIVSMNAVGKFEIISNISEVDIAKIKVGQDVHVTLDAFPTSEKWTGKVERIDPAEKVVEGVIFYETRVLFDQDDPRLKSGMTANLDIDVGRKDGVLLVPLRALQQKPGRTFVQVLKDGKPVERDIVVGIENNAHVEAISGISEGETVVVSTVTPK
jgi:HlyD family secretion protein